MSNIKVDGYIENVTSVFITQKEENKHQLRTLITVFATTVCWIKEPLHQCQGRINKGRLGKRYPPKICKEYFTQHLIYQNISNNCTGTSSILPDWHRHWYPYKVCTLYPQPYPPPPPNVKTLIRACLLGKIWQAMIT